MSTQFKRIDIKMFIATCIFLSTVAFIVLNCIYKGSLLDIADYHDHYMHYYGNMYKSNFPGGPGGYLIFPPFSEMIYGLWVRSDAIAYGNSWSLESISTHSQYLYHLVMVVIFLLFFAIINYIYSKDEYFKRQFLVITLVLSNPFIVPLSIGNTVLPTCLFILIALAFYYSDDKRLVPLSLAFFALASGMKYYPAIYGVVLLKNKDYKNAIKLLILGVLIFVLPLFYFEGFATIPKILTSLKSFNTHLWVGDNLYFAICKTINLIFKVNFLNNSFALNILRFIFLVVGFAGIIISRKRWKLLFYIGFICNICFVNAWGYNTIYFVPAIIYFMLDENEELIDIIRRKDLFKMLYILTFAIFLMNYNFGALNKLPILCLTFFILFEDIKRKIYVRSCNTATSI